MSPAKLQILYEDNHLLAVAKPAGPATVGASHNKPTLVSLAKDYIKRRYKKPGKVYLGVMSRLDAPVSGVVLFARTSKAAARLTEQFRTRAVEKTYLAIVEGIIKPAAGSLVARLGKDEKRRRMRVVGPNTPGAKTAKLTYRTLKTIAGRSLVEITPETGRKHQIRVQFADHGHAILGDRKYGGAHSFSPGIALHARRLAFMHPTKGERIVLQAPLPAAWHRWGGHEPI